jgi:hypothetical protein
MGHCAAAGDINVKATADVEQARGDRCKAAALDLSEMSRLRGLQSHVLEQASIASYLGSEQHYRKADDDYVVAAARVLQRALLLRMPDANRFVVQA